MIRRRALLSLIEYKQIEPSIHNNVICYTATVKVGENSNYPWTFDTFGANVVSHEWNSESGEGVITFDTNVTTIGDNAFTDCDGLTSITIPDSVTTIGNYAFRNCTSLTSATIGDSVTEIGDNAFRGCSSLTSITIPNSVTIIGDIAFLYCDSLKEFTGKFADDNGRILVVDGVLKAFAPAGITEYNIPDGVTSIGYGAFSSYRRLTSVTIPDSVTTIGDWAFGDCQLLESVNIPDRVTRIGSYAFYFCDLTSVTIPDSVTSIGADAFYYCFLLTSVYCKATTPPSLGSSHYVFGDRNDLKIYVPAESVEAYKSAFGWSNYASAIEGYDFGEDGDENGNLITFTIDGIEYQAEEGMTWGQFCNSEYNTGNFIIKNDFIYTTDNKIVNDNNSVHKMSSDEKVISGGVYYITFPEPE